MFEGVRGGLARLVFATSLATGCGEFPGPQQNICITTPDTRKSAETVTRMNFTVDQKLKDYLQGTHRVPENDVESFAEAIEILMRIRLGFVPEQFLQPVESFKISKEPSANTEANTEEDRRDRILLIYPDIYTSNGDEQITIDFSTGLDMRAVLAGYFSYLNPSVRTTGLRGEVFGGTVVLAPYVFIQAAKIFEIESSPSGNVDSVLELFNSYFSCIDLNKPPENPALIFPFIGSEYSGDVNTVLSRIDRIFSKASLLAKENNTQIDQQTFMQIRDFYRIKIINDLDFNYPDETISAQQAMVSGRGFSKDFVEKAKNNQGYTESAISGIKSRREQIFKNDWENVGLALDFLLLTNDVFRLVTVEDFTTVPTALIQEKYDALGELALYFRDTKQYDLYLRCRQIQNFLEKNFNIKIPDQHGRAYDVFRVDMRGLFLDSRVAGVLSEFSEGNGDVTPPPIF